MRQVGEPTLTAPHLLPDAVWEPLKQQGQEDNEVKNKHQAKLAQLTLKDPNLCPKRILQTSMKV